MSIKMKKKPLRKMSKEILRDLWSIARQAHGLDSAPENV